MQPHDNDTANSEASDSGELCDQAKGPSYYDLVDIISDISLSEIQKY